MKNRLATVGLLAFLAVDVALVWFALRPVSPLAGSGAPSTSAPTVSTTETGTPSDSSSSEPETSTTTKQPTTEPVPVSALVTALDATVAWRGTAGTCDRGGSTLETTTDGGATWSEVTPPARALVRVQPLDEKRVFAIGAGADCSLQQYVSPDTGATWDAPTSVAGNWARRLDDPTKVVTPKDSGAEACDGAVVLDLSRTASTDAQALCANGDVVETTDGGSTWSAAGSATGSVALANLASGGTYVARISDSCAGVEVTRVTADRTTTLACVKVKTPKPGEVGIAVTTDSGWLVIGDQTWVSDGRLRSWARP
jgi:hypothetical protein